MPLFNQKRKNPVSNPLSNDTGKDSFFGIQAKLNIGKSNDKYEVEADRVADKVVSNKKPTSNDSFFNSSPSVHKKTDQKIQKNDENEIQEKPLSESITPVVQLQPIEEEKIQKKCSECETEENNKVQTSAPNDASTTASSNLESTLNSSKGGGSTLPKSTKSEMESGFGSDFSAVRIHNDSNAVQMNKELGSQAFANGNDIYFNEGKYNPNSQEGKHLLAHELTHTVQQGAVIRKKRAQITNTSSAPEIQTVAPLIAWGGRYLVGKLISWGIDKAFEDEKDLIDYGDTILKELLSVPIDLKGHSKFEPLFYVARQLQIFGMMTDWYRANKDIASLFGNKFIDQIINGPKLNVKFGNLSSIISVSIRWHEDTQTYEMDPYTMPLNHEAFDTEGKELIPHLAIGIDRIDSSVYGGLILFPAQIETSLNDKEKMISLMNESKSNLKMLVFGEEYDEENFIETTYSNLVLDGNLQFVIAGNQLTSGNQILTGSFGLINESYAWVGNIKTKIKGINSAEIPIERDSKSRLSGMLAGLSLEKSWNINAANFQGSLEASYINGLLDIRGEITYSSERIPHADLTLWVTTKEQAWEAAEKRLPPEAKEQNRQFEKEDELAITGWGSMEIIIVKDKPQEKGKGGPGAKPADNFLTGKAAAVIDPDGFLTMSGEIIMNNEVRFLDAIGGDLKEIAKIPRERLVSFYIYPGILIRIMGEANLKAGYQLGPVDLYQLSISGIYSNNPKINNELGLSARINGVAGLKAQAFIKGDIELRLGAKYDYLGYSPAKVSLSILADGVLGLGMDFAPTIGIKQKKGNEDSEKIPEYFFKGSLNLGGELDLNGKAKIELAVPGTDYKGEYEFLKRTIQGSGITIDWDYTFGDPLTIESLQKMIKFKKGKFSPPKMMREMFKKEEANETNEFNGSYKEKGKKKQGTFDDEAIPIQEPNLIEKELQDDFNMSGTIHHLILHFNKGSKEPELKMASNPELILNKIEIARNTLSAELPNLDKDDRKLMERRLKDLTKIKTAANKVIKNAKEIGADVSNLKKSNIPGFEELGDLISDYGYKYEVDDLSSKPTANNSPGTKENPFEIVWPKPASANYEPLYFGGELKKPKSQKILKNLEGSKDITGNVVKKYTPHKGGTLPGGEEIGISKAYITFEGRIIGPLSSDGTPKGDKLNRILKRYGYLPGRNGDGMDADHIIEIQLGGKDIVANLWPLDSNINQKSGQKLKDSEVIYPKTGKKEKIKELKKRMKKYYFKIIKFEY